MAAIDARQRRRCRRSRVGLVDQAVGAARALAAEEPPAHPRTLRELTRKLEADGAELTIWPEAAYPYALAHDARAGAARRAERSSTATACAARSSSASSRRRSPSTRAAGGVERNSYNSATLVLPDGTLQPPYDKLQLLWFGETVPRRRQLPWLRRLFQKSGGLLPGIEPRALDAARASAGPSLRIGVLNCYEDTLAGRRPADRRRARARTCSSTSPTTPGSSARPSPSCTRGSRAMRAIELRRDLVRAVNLGVTSWIDAAGRRAQRVTSADAAARSGDARDAGRRRSRLRAAGRRADRPAARRSRRVACALPGATRRAAKAPRQASDASLG